MSVTFMNTSHPVTHKHSEGTKAHTEYTLPRRQHKGLPPCHKRSLNSGMRAQPWRYGTLECVCLCVCVCVSVCVCVRPRGLRLLLCHTARCEYSPNCSTRTYMAESRPDTAMRSCRTWQHRHTEITSLAQSKHCALSKDPLKGATLAVHSARPLKTCPGFAYRFWVLEDLPHPREHSRGQTPWLGGKLGVKPARCSRYSLEFVPESTLQHRAVSGTLSSLFTAVWVAFCCDWRALCWVCCPGSGNLRAHLFG